MVKLYFHSEVRLGRFDVDVELVVDVVVVVDVVDVVVDVVDAAILPFFISLHLEYDAH